MKMTLGTLLEEGKEKLEKAGVPDPLLDARFLLLDVFDMNFASFLVKRGRPLTGTENGINGTDADSDTLKKIEKYRELISKREMRIPLQQLTGVQEFMGHDISKPGEMDKVLEKGLMFDLCPQIVLDVLSILEELV